MKKVIFLMIDSLMPHILEECIFHNKAPALSFFKERGMYWDQCVTCFPTMTASVDFSLVTGVFPENHGIPSLLWYHPEERRIVNYINGMLPVLRLGIANCIEDVLCNLNDRHLNKNVKTIFEELALQGRTTGSINFIAHRAYHKYKVDLPFMVKLATGFRRFGDISGPDLFTLGSLAQSKMDPPLPWGWDQSLFRHYGINDDFAIRVVKHAIEYEMIPDFTMVYLPDNDHQVHKHPDRAVETLSKVDKRLQKLLNLFSSWDEAIEKFVFIITGDHGQTTIGKSKGHNILLEEHFKGLKVTPYGEKSSENDDVVIANNERMSFVYPLHPGMKHEIISRLQKDERIDLIAWKEGTSIAVCSGGKPGMCKFWKDGEMTDIYGEKWTIHGHIERMDLHISPDKQTIAFGDYPDVLSRLHGTLYSQQYPMIVCTAKKGYEFKTPYAPTHLGGGSHGSLHRVDSIIPLIICGANDLPPPRFEFPRIVDLKTYIMDILQPEHSL